MTTTMQSGSRLTAAMRWCGRAVGLLAFGLFLQFIAESGTIVLPALSWSSPQGVPLFVVLAAAVAGGLIAWRWEGLGGAMAVGGAVAIIGLVYVGSGPSLLLAALILTLPLFVCGGLCLGCCWRTRRTSVSQQV